MACTERVNSLPPRVVEVWVWHKGFLDNDEAAAVIKHQIRLFYIIVHPRYISYDLSNKVDPCVAKSSYFSFSFSFRQPDTSFSAVANNSQAAILRDIVQKCVIQHRCGAKLYLRVHHNIFIFLIFLPQYSIFSRQETIKKRRASLSPCFRCHRRGTEEIQLYFTALSEVCK